MALLEDIARRALSKNMFAVQSLRLPKEVLIDVYNTLERQPNHN